MRVKFMAMQSLLMLIGINSCIYLIHKGMVDIKVWSMQRTSIKHEKIRLRFWYLINDYTYLGGTFFMMFSLAFTCWYAGSMGIGLLPFTYAFLIGSLIGDEIWDLGFGYVLHDDILFPFSDWFGGWGFGSKMERVTFDLCRIGLAVFFYSLLLILIKKGWL